MNHEISWKMEGDLWKYLGGGGEFFLGNSFYMDDDSSNRASIYKFAKEIKILLNFRTM